MSESDGGFTRDAFRDHVKRSRPRMTKQEFVERACLGRKVLDIGCIDHSADNAIAAGDQWLHHRIRHVASSVVGIDVLTEDAERLKTLGYSIIVADAEALELDERFDVVVGADVVEHLSNVGAFLLSVREHLEPEGLLVLTTPNPFALAFTAHVLATGSVPVNDEHVGWYDPSLLQEALRRAGFGIREFAWLKSPESGPSRRSRVLDRLLSPLLRARPMLQRNFGIVASPFP